MEFGYKASKELFDVKGFGKWKFCDEEDIRAIVGENDSPLKLSVMADVGRCDFKKDILPKSESVIDMIRIATYTHQMPGALEMINYCHGMGYETTINIMAVSASVRTISHRLLTLWQKALLTLSILLTATAHFSLSR